MIKYINNLNSHIPKKFYVIGEEKPKDLGGIILFETIKEIRIYCKNWNKKYGGLIIPVKDYWAKWYIYEVKNFDTTSQTIQKTKFSI